MTEATPEQIVAFLTGAQAMTDIVERLCDGEHCTVGCAKLRAEAAAEIEQLREHIAALQLVATAHDAEIARLRAALQIVREENDRAKQAPFSPYAFSSPPREVAVGLVEASESGDRRATLEALRDRLARAVDSESSLSVLAPLANQLRAVLADLEDLPAKKGGSIVDDLAARRTDRRSAAQGGDVPVGGDISRS